jgi:rhamnogalacturonyl hydrolase YesR
MKMVKCRVLLGLAASLLLFVPANAKKTKTEKSSESTLQMIERVNDVWQANHSADCSAFWVDGAYFTGNMEAYRLTGKAAYLEYSDKWCRHNNWMGARSNDRSQWQYKTYGSDNSHVLFADWQICFQTYMDMYTLNPNDYKIARAKEVMSYEASLKDSDFWWWSDALYMGMPVFSKLYKITGDRTYLDKLYENFCYTDNMLFDKEEGLYYRDAKYVYPKVKTVKGGKSFWARGDGWVLAGLAKVLTDMPADYAHRNLFVERFKTLAASVARCQQKGGYWTRSLLCEADAPGYETSGTAFFTYGLLWGVNHGLLDKATYAPVINKAWNYLTKVALQADGTIGYVQPIGEKPDPKNRVDANSQAPFGTGAWLLAACEMARYQNNGGAEASEGAAKTTAVVKIEVKNPSDRQRSQVVALDAKTIFAKLGINGGRQFVVRNAFGREIPSQLTYDGQILFYASANTRNVSEYSIVKGTPADYTNSVYGRMYPERVDDIAWENDCSAYRCYGPALQKSGEKAYGIDIWLKNTPELVVESRYRKEDVAKAIVRDLKKQGKNAEAQAYEDSQSYHIDHGNGLDCYKVGPTLGCGATAFLDGDNLIMPYCWKEYQILDNGPLRFTVRMTYNPLTVGSDNNVVETRVLSLDKGSHLNKMQVSYANLSAPHALASGIVIHTEDTKTLAIDEQNRTIAYADPTDDPQHQNFQIYVGSVYPEALKSMRPLMYNAPSAGASGHAVGVVDYQPGSTFTYYFGSAWSKFDMPSFDIWQLYLKQYADNLKNPLQVTVE